MKHSLLNLTKYVALSIFLLLLALIIVRAASAWQVSQRSRIRGQESRRADQSLTTRQRKALAARVKGIPQGEAFRILIDEGDPNTAKTYYEEMAKKLGFPNDLPPADMDALLEYCGYRGLKATDIEKLPSDILMDFARLKENISDKNKPEFAAAFSASPIAPGDILATRFFAPKITDVSGLVTPVAYGWRKLVRLRVRSGSLAASKNVVSLSLLFNCFDTDLKKNPFDAISQNNQAMLIQESPSNGYWLVFGSLEDGGKRIDFLTATFDARDPKIDNNLPPGQRKYYLPAACANCHGEGNPKLNYLDTDHWIDRVQPNDDFAEVGASTHGVLFDGGTNENSAEYKRAFEVIRQLNQEILEQNQKSDTNENAFQIRAVKNWLRIHDGNTQYLRPIDRAIPPINAGGRVWTKGDSTDEALLPLLNQYCFRCHSSVSYHVFDKETVFRKRNSMRSLINLPDTEINLRMPQDRNLSQPQKDELTRLLKALK